jgi:hypothetical protein
LSKTGGNVRLVEDAMDDEVFLDNKYRKLECGSAMLEI